MNNNTLNPVRAFGDLMEELINGNQPRFFRDDFLNEGRTKHYRHIPVNISEKDNSYRLEVVAPGLKKEDLKVNVSENVLHISFETKEENKETSDKDHFQVLREEFRMQSFKRSFKLGEKVDADKISARYEDGILYLEIPKKEAEKTTNKSIEIA